MTDAELKKLLEQAAEKGAELALAKVGLGDEHAGKDIRDLRALIDDWRAVRGTFIRTAIGTLTKIALGAMAAGAYFKFWGHHP